MAMTLSSYLGAYDDCSDIFERATFAKRGIRVSVGTVSDGHVLFSRLNYYRVLLRDLSRTSKNPDDPEWGRCSYDNLVVRKPKELDGEWWIYIEPRGQVNGIEEL